MEPVVRYQYNAIRMDRYWLFCLWIFRFWFHNETAWHYVCEQLSNREKRGCGFWSIAHAVSICQYLCVCWNQETDTGTDASSLLLYAGLFVYRQSGYSVCMVFTNRKDIAVEYIFIWSDGFTVATFFWYALVVSDYGHDNGLYCQDHSDRKNGYGSSASRRLNAVFFWTAAKRRRQHCQSAIERTYPTTSL